jgi:hypothetical protein
MEACSRRLGQNVGRSRNKGPNLGIFEKLKGIQRLKICLYKNLLMNVYSSFTHNHPKLTGTKTSFNREINTLWYIHTLVPFNDKNN